MPKARTNFSSRTTHVTAPQPAPSGPSFTTERSHNQKNTESDQPPSFAPRLTHEGVIEGVHKKTARLPLNPSQNRTGIPNSLKTGIEHLAGISIGDVRVHYNSSRPNKFQALAIAQGTQIYIAPGQTEHLPHEAWHVVQQKQGRVRAEGVMNGVPLNNDQRLEHEANLMGQRALTAGAALAKENRVAGAAGTQATNTSNHSNRMIQPMFDGDEINENTNGDHPEGNETVERLIDWAQLTPKGLKDLPDEALYRIFLNLAAYHYQKLGEILPSYPSPYYDWQFAYDTWLYDGSYTRSRFKRLIGLYPQDGDYKNYEIHDGQKIVQSKRKGDTFSFNGIGYTGSNKLPYQNVIYHRSSVGNIDFDTDPKMTLRDFNFREGKNINANQIKWRDPVDPNSYVQLNNHLTDDNLGVMPSGKSVDLRKASRGQHFSIADMLVSKKTDHRIGTWTWHHLTPRYWMVLVDMEVHRKHGHNGGVLLWK